jgi:hypothetical protein
MLTMLGSGNRTLKSRKRKTDKVLNRLRSRLPSDDDLDSKRKRFKLHEPQVFTDYGESEDEQTMVSASLVS